MESSGSSMSSIANEATQLLKDILNVGKPASARSSNGMESDNSDIVQSSISTMDMVTESRADSSNKDGNSMYAEIHAEIMHNMHQPNMHQPKLTNQHIVLQGNDTANSFSVYAQTVDVFSSNASGSTSQNAGSNKVKINPVVNYDWELKYYIGNLVALHRSGNYLAYVLKGQTNGIVRILNRKTAERALLRGFVGKVKDIAFAHLSAVVLGAVDEIGNLFIHEILEDKNGKTEVSLLLQIDRPEKTAPSDNHRLIWCPYIPDEDDPSGTTANTTSDSSVTDDAGKLLVLTHDEKAEMWNVDMVTREHGKGPLKPDEVEHGFLTINDHTKPIVDAAFSPDGTALATASLDGEVKFFQVYLQDGSSPRCLHQWQPHDGKPVSSLFFLDDHKHPNAEVQFWKFAVTGADHNQEIKIWSCESWSCLQTLRFFPPVGVATEMSMEPCLKASMDLSASYLTLSDIRRRVLYVLQIYQHPEETRAHVSSISEFLLAQPPLSFTILDAKRARLKQRQEDNTFGDVTTWETGGGEDDEEVTADVVSPDVGILVKMYSVQTKALQELQIRFRPESSVPGSELVSSASFSQDGFRDGLSDLSMDALMIDGENNQLNDRSNFTDRSNFSERSHGSDVSHISDRTHHTDRGVRQSEDSHVGEVSYHSDQSAPTSDHSREGSEPKLVLLAPEAFTSPRKTDPPPAQDSVRSSGSSFTQVTGMDDHSVVPSHPSPASSTTLTPSSSHDISAKDTPSSVPATPVITPKNTPSSVPVPPISAQEEAELISTPTSSTGPLPTTPPSSSRGQGTFPTAPSLTSSPAVSKPGGSSSPHHMIADQSTIQSSTDTVSDFFGLGVDAASRRGVLRSTGSSSSASLEVREILEGALHAATVNPDLSPGALCGDGVVMGDIRVVEIRAELENINAEAASPPSPPPKPPIETSPRDPEPSGFWPSPPDVSEVNRETHHLATQAIERAAHLHRLANVNTLDEEPGDEEDDVQIEEVKEEIVDDEPEVEEEEEEMEDDVEVVEEEEEVVVVNAAASKRPQPSGMGLPKDLIHEPAVESVAPAAATASSAGDGPTLVTVVDYQQSAADKESITQMQNSLQHMLTILQTQQNEIKNLRSELQQQQQSNEAVDHLQRQLDQLEEALSSTVTGALTQHHNAQSQHIQQALSDRDTVERQRQERLIHNLTQTLERTVTQRLDKAVKDEMRRSVVPGVMGILEPLREQLHIEMAQKLTATDGLLKENIGKMCRSRQTMEAIGQAAANAVQGPIQVTCREVVIPSFDRSCQNMFQQVNDSFQRGTQEYLQQLEGHLDQVRRRHEEGRDPIVGQLRAMVDTVKHLVESQKPVTSNLQGIGQSLQASADRIQASQMDIEPIVQKAVTRLEDKLLTSMRKMIQDEVSSALRDQSEVINNSVLGALRSTAVTPQPMATTPDPQISQTHLMSLLRQGQINSAFQQALSASDLNLVMFVCETVKPAQLFNQQPCPLHQPVLLSLIQQLSVDLTQHSELKHKYLEEAVMNLDTTNPVTREHMGAVVGGLSQRLMTHLQAHPTDRMARQMRMLLMASQGLLK